MSSAPRFPGALRWLLGASLALNLALLLALILPWLGLRPGLHGAHTAPMLPVPSAYELRTALPAERRALVDQVLSEHRRGIRRALGETRRARRQLDRLLRSESIDQSALDAAFAEVRRGEGAAAEAVHRMMSELMVQLTPEERNALAERFGRRHGRHRHREDAAHAPVEPG